MVQVGPVAPLAAHAARAGAAPQAIQQQAPTTYYKKFAGRGDFYGGAYLPLLQLHHPEVVLAPTMAAQTVFNLSAAHGGLPSVYAYQTHDTDHIWTLHRVSQTSSLPGLTTQ